MIALLLAFAVAIHPSVPVRTPHGVPVRGVASWYDATRNHAWYTRDGNRLYGAVGSFRWGDKPYRVKVCLADQVSRCVIVVISDYCERCWDDLHRRWTRFSRNIDLSPQAFAVLRGLHLGVARVIITEVLVGR